jgi:putative ABC transport system permease protein
MTSIARLLVPAWRALGRRPAFALACVGTLAFGMGATVALFSVLNAVVLRDLPWPAAERTVVLSRQLDSGVRDPDFSERELRAFASDAALVERAGAFLYGGANLLLDGRAYGLWVTQVSADLLGTLGARPARGRLFSEEDFGIGAAPVVVLSDVLWRATFGGDPAVVGRTLTLDGVARRIVGVLPPDFRLPTDYRWEGQTEVWTPLPLPGDPARLGRPYLWMVARLPPGITRETARGRLDVALGRLAASFPADYEQSPAGRVHLRPVAEEVLGQTRPAILLMMAAVVVVLLIGCANVAHLLLARAEERQRDFALRAALGAARGRLLGEVLAESTLLALAAGAAGLVLACIFTPMLLALAPANLPRLEHVAMDGTVVGFAAGLSLATPLLFGLVPALRASRQTGAASLHPSDRGGTRAGRGLRRALIAGEVALASALLAASLLLVKSFARLHGTDPGFDTASVITGDVILPPAHHRETPQVLEFFDALRAEVAARPGVRGVGLNTMVPFWSPATRVHVQVEARPETGRQPASAALQAISADLLETAGIDLLEGRRFGEGDREGAPLVALVNRTFARALLDAAPLGARLRLAGGPERPWVEVVGVVEDVREEAVDRPARPQVYLPFRQLPASTGEPARYMALVVRADDPAAVVPEVRAALARVGPEVPIASVRTLEQRRSQSAARYRFATALLAVMAATACVLAGVGVFAVLAYTVGRRRREIAIRVAVGARAGQVVPAVVGEGLAMAGAGLVLGGLAARALGRSLETVLYEVSPGDPAAFAAAAAGIVACAALAAWLPARRALAVDPARVLRSE